MIHEINWIGCSLYYELCVNMELHNEMGGNTVKKRHRRPNFSHQEMCVLADEVWLNKASLFGTKSCSMVSGSKNKVWSKIAVKISAVAGIERTKDEIKKKWTDWASLTKIKASKLKDAAIKCDGSMPDVRAFSQLEEKVLAILGINMQGLGCSFSGEDNLGQSTDKWSTETQSLGSPMTVHSDESFIIVKQEPVSPSSSPNSKELQNIHTKDDTPTNSVDGQKKSNLDETSHEMQVMKRQKVDESDGQKTCEGKKHNEGQKTGQTSEIIKIEKERLVLERERIEIERKRLFIEEQRLDTEKQLVNKLTEFILVVGKHGLAGSGGSNSDNQPSPSPNSFQNGQV